MLNTRIWRVDLVNIWIMPANVPANAFLVEGVVMVPRADIRGKQRRHRDPAKDWLRTRQIKHWKQLEWHKVQRNCQRGSSRFADQRCLAASSVGGARQMRSLVLNHVSHTSMANIGTQHAKTPSGKHGVTRARENA